MSPHITDTVDVTADTLSLDSRLTLNRCSTNIVTDIIRCWSSCKKMTGVGQSEIRNKALSWTGPNGKYKCPAVLLFLALANLAHGQIPSQLAAQKLVIRATSSTIASELRSILPHLLINFVLSNTFLELGCFLNKLNSWVKVVAHIFHFFSEVRLRILQQSAWANKNRQELRWYSSSE